MLEGFDFSVKRAKSNTSRHGEEAAEIIWKHPSHIFVAPVDAAWSRGILSRLLFELSWKAPAAQINVTPRGNGINQRLFIVVNLGTSSSRTCRFPLKSWPAWFKLPAQQLSRSRLNEVRTCSARPGGSCGRNKN